MSGVDKAFSLLLAFTFSLQAQSYIVKTVAGTGPPDVGDGDQATKAILVSPYSVMAAPGGVIYIVDTYNHRIRRVDVNGIITTFAGTGSAESQPPLEGIPANIATFRFPRWISRGPDGSFYVADGNYYLIRRIDAQGIVTTVAGNRNPYYEGENVPAKQASFGYPIAVVVDQQGNVYVADQPANRVRMVGTDGIIRTIAGTGEAGTSGDNGPAIRAKINSPNSLALDTTRHLLYVGTVDGARRINLVTGEIQSVGPAGYCLVSLDARGRLLLSRQTKIILINETTGVANTLAGTDQSGFSGDGGPATQARLRDIRGLSADTLGNIYIADTGNNRIRKISSNGNIDTYAGGRRHQLEGRADSVVVFDSQGLGLDRFGNLFFADFQNNLIRRLDRYGYVKTIAGTGVAGYSSDEGHPLNVSFSAPRAITFDRFGNLLFIDATEGTGAVRLISPGVDGEINGSSDERIITIAGRIRPRAEANHGASDGGPARNAIFNAARGLALDSAGNMYIADALDHVIRKVVPGADDVFNGGTDEIISTIAGNWVGASTGDGGQALSASLWNPNALAFDSKGYLYVNEGNGNRKVRRIDLKTGLISTYTTTLPGLTNHICFDPYDRLIFGGDGRLYSVDPESRTRTIIAGTGDTGFGGDGGLALNATFRSSEYFTADSVGNIFLADNGNFRIRKLTRISVPSHIKLSSSYHPARFYLSHNYPNPFNPATTITFILPVKSFVSLKIFDALGREVQTLVSEELSSGKYSTQWNAAGLGSGVYFYRLQAGSFMETKKLLLLR
jgi:sugar lactone lactonase YvrE